MNEQKASTTNTETLTTVQTKMLPALIEWGVGFSFILACVTVGSVTFYFSLHFIGLQIGGVVGGIIIGFMPYLTQQIRIPRIRWQAILFTNLTVILVFFVISAYYFYQEAVTAQIFAEANGHYSMTVYSRFASGLRILFLTSVLYSVTGAIIGVTTRWVYRRWLRLKLKHLALSVLFVILLFGLLPYRVMVGNHQFALFWLLPVALAILLFFPFWKKVSDIRESSKYASIPLIIGFSIASVHFLLSYFLLEPSTFICSNSRWSLLATFFMIPGWGIGALPFISSLLDILTNIRIDEFYLRVFISSSYYGYASSFLVKQQKYDLLIGIILLSIPILFGSFLIFGAIATGCGA